MGRYHKKIITFITALGLSSLAESQVQLAKATFAVIQKYQKTETETAAKVMY